MRMDKTLIDKVIKLLRDAADRIDSNRCAHEETERGGTNWTICSACRARWADDEGGMPPYVPHPLIAECEAMANYLSKPQADTAEASAADKHTEATRMLILANKVITRAQKWIEITLDVHDRKTHVADDVVEEHVTRLREIYKETELFTGKLYSEMHNPDLLAANKLDALTSALEALERFEKAAVKLKRASFSGEHMHSVFCNAPVAEGFGNGKCNCGITDINHALDQYREVIPLLKGTVEEQTDQEKAHLALMNLQSCIWNIQQSNSPESLAGIKGMDALLHVSKYFTEKKPSTEQPIHDPT